MDKEARELQTQLAKEAKELQIKIAQLNAKLRINIAAVFGLIALSGAFILAGYQLILGEYGVESINQMKVNVSIVFFVFSGIVAIVAFSYWLKLRSCEKEFDNLK